MSSKLGRSFKLKSEFNPHSRALGDTFPEALKELAEEPEGIKLPGWQKFNELTGGFRKKEFTVLCGATGAGKTTLLANWAKGFMLAQQRVFVMSVENGATDFVKRTMSAFGGRDYNRGMKATPEELQLFYNQHGKAFTSDALYLSLYETKIDSETVEQEILWHKEKKQCDIVFIDNLNFLMETVSANRQMEIMDKTVHDLVELTKAADIHLVMVMHPRKTEHGRVESEFDIKGSSTAVQEAYNIFLFNRPMQKDIDSQERGIYMRELMVRKVRRRGESIGKSLWLRYTGANYEEVSVEQTKINTSRF